MVMVNEKPLYVVVVKVSFHMRLYISQCTLSCPHMAGAELADPQHSLLGVSLLQCFPKSVPTQTLVQLATPMLTFTTASHLTVIHSTCT